jgi:hypothetical protein
MNYDEAHIPESKRERKAFVFFQNEAAGGRIAGLGTI